jgi:UBX domain-containing protein 1
MVLVHRYDQEIWGTPARHHPALHVPFFVFAGFVNTTMPNINTLFSNKSKNEKEVDDNSDEEENTRYVGGASSRGGSGLAVIPDRDPNRSAIFQRAEQGGSNADENDTRRRVITMYRDGFTVDDGPYRRLDDPSNRDFLSSLARGVTPRELMSDSVDGGEISVGLVDKRNEDYVETFQSFSGVGQSLGVSSLSVSGVIDPRNTPIAESPSVPADKVSKLTSIQIRLLSGKRLVVKLPLNAPVQALVREILVSGDAGSEPFVLMGGFPPRQVTDLSNTIENAGLAGSSVTQKKA